MSEELQIDRVQELKRLRGVTEKLVADLEASPNPDPEKIKDACAMLERIREELLRSNSN